MSAFRALVLAIDLAATQRDQALKQLQATQRAHGFAQGQMQQLQQYAQETDQRWIQSAQRSTTPELLHHQYQFMGRLSQAIALQQDALANSARRVEAAQQAVVQAELRLAAFKQVLKQRELAHGTLMQRREQKQMDEFAAQQTQRCLRAKLENQT
jgi:flagellar FliJ protein